MPFDKEKYLEAKQGFAKELKDIVDRYMPQLNASDLSDALVGFGVSIKISIAVQAMAQSQERRIMVAQAADDLLKGGAAR